MSEYSDEREDDTQKNGKIIQRYIEEEMKKSYIDYAMSVIVGRALPGVRDGLKPVHRRILYSMYEGGFTSGKPHKKSARIVGDVLGKYHPHGDTAVYDTMVRMAQDFSLRYPLVDGHGNFGSIDGDNPAAMRYTESRMAKIAEEMLEDLQKNTVDFMPNYDSSLKEPTVLPAKLPNLLINGSSGIAVGMATNIPPHNLTEIVDGVIALIDNPDIEIRELMTTITAPDFPTGGTIYGINGILQAYTTGRGHIKIRANTKMEEMKNDKKRIIVYELPYQVNKARLLESIASLVKDKRIEGITDLRDESDRDGMRVVIELRRDITPELILNQLFKHTQMETTFGVINLALVDNQPKVLTLKETLFHYIEHRKEIVRRRTQFDLDKATQRAHILEGLIIALDNIDKVIELIRKAKNVEEANNSLISEFDLSEKQSKAILEMRLQKLTSLEVENAKKELEEVLKKIEELKGILDSEQKILDIIKEEIITLKRKYGDERRTQVVEAEEEIDIEDLIPVEDVVISITNDSYIKRIPIDTYRMQKRGGKGLKGMKTKEEDFVKDVFVTSTHDYILFFTTKGKVYWLKGYRIPLGGRHAKGKAIINLLPQLEEGETVNSAIPVKVFDEEHYLVFATKNGIIKKTVLQAYSRPRVTGIRAINLDENDELIDTKLSDGDNQVVLATRGGRANRFFEGDVRSMGRVSRGVIGIRLRKGDEVVSMTLVKEDSILLTITENGFGKCSVVSSYRKTNRGSQGVITIKISERNGKVVVVKEVFEDEELIISSTSGMIIRIPVSGIRVQGRATMGVRIMRLDEDDKVCAVGKLVIENGENNEEEIEE